MVSKAGLWLSAGIVFSIGAANNTQGQTSTVPPQGEATMLAAGPAGPRVVSSTTGVAPSPTGAPGERSGGGAPGMVVGSGPVWSYSSAAEGWVPRTISIGDAGTQVFSAVGPFTDYSRAFSSFDIDPPVPILQYTNTAPTMRQKVASASGSDLHVETFDVDGGQPGMRRVVFKAFSSTTAASNWTYLWPTLTNGHDKFTVRTSRDGSRIVAMVYNVNTGKLDVAVFGPTSATPQATFTVDQGASYTALDLSADGRRLALIGNLRAQIIDVPSGQVLYSTLLFVSTYSSLGLSGDGNTMAYGIDGGVRIVKRNPTTGVYALAYTYTLAGPNYCAALDVSDDGSTLAAAFNFTDAYRRVDVVALDVASYAVTMTDSVVGQGAWQNSVADVSLSADGKRFALGLWGDELGYAPELRVYRRDQAAPLRSVDLPGSIVDLDMSADGRRVAVAAKAVHANVVGSGGSLQLFEASSLDVTVQGVPHPGGTVTARLSGTPGTPAILLVSGNLATTPTTFPNIGTVWLNRSSLTPISAGMFDGLGHASVTLNVGPTAGSTMYLQGYSSNPRRLGTDWVKVTAVP